MGFILLRKRPLFSRCAQVLSGLILILLSTCYSPSTESANPNSQPQVVSCWYKSFEHFLDSLTQSTGISYAPQNCKTDTTFLGNNNFRVLTTINGIKQYYHYYGHQEKSPYQNTADSCFSFLQYGSIKWAEKNLQCQFEMTCPEGNEFTFGKAKFIYSMGVPMNNCNGVFCRVIYYPVFAVNGRDTSLYEFIQVNNPSGLRYADFNKDKNLDFLKIENFISDVEFKKMVQRNKEIEKLSCDSNGESQCYKITAITFKDGKWSLLKDQQGKPYYLFIRLDEFLDTEAGFILLDTHWFE